MPSPQFSAVDAVPIWCGLSAGFAISARWVHARRILCVRAGRNRDRGALLFPSFVLLGIAGHEMAGERRRIHGFCGEIRHDKIDRSDIAAVRFPVGGMDASDRLRALPDSRRDGARSGRRTDQIRFGARSRSTMRILRSFPAGRSRTASRWPIKHGNCFSAATAHARSANCRAACSISTGRSFRPTRVSHR